MIRLILTAFVSILTLSLPVFLGGCSSVEPKTTGDKAFAVEFLDFKYSKVPLVHQTEQESCGAAALASVIQYWSDDSGVTVTEPQLISDYPAYSKEGYPLLQLREIALDKDLLAFGVTLDKNPLNQLLEHVGKGRPVITAMTLPKGRYFSKDLPLIETFDRRAIMGPGDRWKNHYVVVMGSSSGELLLMDPQYGYVSIGKGDFMEYWKQQGYSALIVSAKPQGVQVAKN